MKAKQVDMYPRCAMCNNYMLPGQEKLVERDANNTVGWTVTLHKICYPRYRMRIKERA